MQDDDEIFPIVCDTLEDYPMRPLVNATVKALEGLRSSVDYYGEDNVYDDESITYNLGAANAMLRVFADMNEAGMVSADDLRFVRGFYTGSIADSSRFWELNASAERLGYA